MLFNLYFSKKPKNQKPKNLHLEKTKKPIKKPKNLTMPTMVLIFCISCIISQSETIRYDHRLSLVGNLYL